MTSHDGTETARAYDLAGAGYRDYADGDTAKLFNFSGRYSFADRELWARIDAALVALRAQGRHAIRILDFGCGPGTWLLRTAARAHDLGFTAVEGRGIDISPAMIALARQAAADLRDAGIGITFDMSDILETLEQEGPHACDIALCLYGVLNHVAPETFAAVARGLAQVADGALIATVRTAGSLPSIFFTGMEQARRVHQDHEHDRLEIDMADGSHIEFGLHLFRASEVRALFAPYCTIRELVGIDLFHSRFLPQQGWNPVLDDDAALDAGLSRLEHFCAADPVFIDRAAHILLHAEPIVT
jgi:SAM-dependent methyltransferase